LRKKGRKDSGIITIIVVVTSPVITGKIGPIVLIIHSVLVTGPTLVK
jgi:hypothetical protein